MVVAAWIVFIFSLLALLGSKFNGVAGVFGLVVLIGLLFLSSIIIFDDITTFSELKEFFR